MVGGVNVSGGNVCGASARAAVCVVFAPHPPEIKAISMTAHAMRNGAC